MNPITTRRRARPQISAAVALTGAALTVLGTLMSWVGLTVLVSISVSGTETTEGKITLALAVVAAVTAVIALVARDPRAMIATAFAGFAALVAELVFAFRLADAFSDAVADTENEKFVEDLVTDALSLESGWIVALIGTILMIGAAIYATAANRRV